MSGASAGGLLTSSLYIDSCNDTDYSFFGSLNYKQTGVHVEGIAGHNNGTETAFRQAYASERTFAFSKK